MRVVAPQPWPELRAHRMMLGPVSSAMSAPGSKMVADLPPSSSTSRFVVRAADCMIRCPTASDPVNMTMSTASWDASTSPASVSPMMKLPTPGGRPTCSTIFTRAMVDSGVRGDGLKTSVQPAAIPGPSFQITELIGKL